MIQDASQVIGQQFRLLLAAGWRRGWWRACTGFDRFWHDVWMNNPSKSSASAVTVLYDGACPLCRREIGVYRGLAALRPIAWCDVSAPQAALPDGNDRAAYLARFHVQLADGTVLSGAAAFVALWSVLPGWRWLGRLGRLPGVMPVMEVAYRLFLRLRPAMQRIARRIESRHPARPLPPDRVD